MLLLVQGVCGSRVEGLEVEGLVGEGSRGSKGL